MTSVTPEALEGARNMLVACGGLTAGDQMLLVTELGDRDYYRPGVRAAVLAVAREIGLKVDTIEVAFAEAVAQPPEALVTAMRAARLTVFLARMGDQMRFAPDLAGSRALVSYALDANMLGSQFGCLAHDGMVRVRDAADRMLAAATHIQVTCPAGTDFSGHILDPAAPTDTSTIRFPLSVFTPILAAGFSGRIVQRGFLVGTGSAFYKPYACEIEGDLSVSFTANKITGFGGSDRDIKAAKAHYTFVAERYGIDPRFIHSWHAGIHPGSAFEDPASASFERWSSGAFGNPRLLHAHTCGRFAPGEISLNILDHTITVDGVAVWDKGVLHPDRIPRADAILRRHPDLKAAYDNPARACGEGPMGGLSFG